MRAEKACPGKASGKAGNHPLLYRLISLFLFLSVWQLLTLKFPPMVLPTIPGVLQKLLLIVQGKKFVSTLLLTVTRFLAGLLIGITIGTALGILSGVNRHVEGILSPFVSVLQTVPPVCWVVLALVWFGFNGKPCIFIVATATVPPMVLNLNRGVHSIDPELLQMAYLYHFSKRKILAHVILPSIRPFYLSALNIVIGSGWKLVVMAEVLTTSTGIGGAITTARLNIEPDAIIAWAFILVLLCFATEKLLKLLLLRGGKKYA